MSQMVDGSADEDRLSLRSNGSVGVKETTFGRIRSSFRSNLSRVAEKIPLSPGSKGSKLTPEADDSRPSPPPSPSEYHRGRY